MKRRFVALPLIPMAIVSCAARRDTGAAMVVTGAGVAAIGAQSAGSTYCTSPGMCVTRQGGSKAATAMVAAGAALAVAGQALIESQKGDQAPSRVKPDRPPKDWTLRRSDDPEESQGASGSPSNPASPQTPTGASSATPASPSATSSGSPGNGAPPNSEGASGGGPQK